MWRVYPGSRIERLPRPVRPFAIAARKLTEPDPPHRGDGITTIHNDGFRNDPLFLQAYSRAVRAAGWDYQIPYRVHQALWCARLALRVPGDFVELGTGRGFFMSAILEGLGPKRSVHLFDTFSSLSLDRDGKQTGPRHDRFAESFESVAANFAQWESVRLHRGDVFETLPEAKIESVAFLHVDMNHPAPEVFGIRHLWPLMPKGAVMLLDDYAYSGFEAQYQADNELAKELGFDILSTPTGQGIVIK